MPPLAPDLFGKILLSRFLELPLRRFDSFVKKLDADSHALQHSGIISAGTLSGSRLSPSPPKEGQTFGEIVMEEGHPQILWHSSSFVREYRMDDTVISRLLGQEGIGGGFGRTVRRLRLVNSRNRLASHIVRFVLHAQAEYIRTGDLLALRPLPYVRLSEKLLFSPWFPKGIDPTRISRILRHFPLVYPVGNVRELSELCPTFRTTCCHFVNDVIKSEKSLIQKGSIHGPLSDGEIARRIEEAFAVSLSRRTVAHIRRALGIPERIGRTTAEIYRDATAGFSLPVPLSPCSVRESAPVCSGVYEISSFVPGEPEKVLYIGSSRNLRKRLSHHLYSSGGNPLLRERISEGARFRYRIFEEDWRTAERTLYRSFLNTFGTPPECNRASP